MVGTHNSMTYLEATHWHWELLSPWWRCQDKTLEEQLAMGVRFFDLRVIRGTGNRTWNWGHGLVDLGPAAIGETLDRLGECGATCRIMLERGDEDTESEFTRFFSKRMCDRLWKDVVKDVVIKKGWRVIWRSDDMAPIVDGSWVPYRRGKAWWKQLRGLLSFPFTTIRGWSLRHQNAEDYQWQATGRVWYYDFTRR